MQFAAKLRRLNQYYVCSHITTSLELHIQHEGESKSPSAFAFFFTLNFQKLFYIKDEILHWIHFWFYYSKRTNFIWKIHVLKKWRVPQCVLAALPGRVSHSRGDRSAEYLHNCQGLTEKLLFLILEVILPSQCVVFLIFKKGLSPFLFCLNSL